MSFRGKFVWTSLALCLALALVPAATAQLVQGSLTGNVTDSTQAAIPGAAVTITNEGTGVTRSADANEYGAFNFQSIDPGLYTLEVKTDGFQTHRETGIVVTANSAASVTVALEIGQVTETIEVQASAVTLQTTSAAVHQQVTQKTLRNMPVPLGRNYQMLFVTLPGFSPPQNAHSVPTNPSRAVRFSVNGTSRSNNNTRIDGASTTNIWVPHMTGYNPALESIESVDVVTNSFDAEQGLAGGAAINLTIKSGTNDFHGSAFEYNTTQKTMAYPWDNPRTDRKPKFIYNQFGATVGGPIIKNKWFFFASYEGTRESQFASRSVDLPTQEMRFGDLSGAQRGVYDPLSTAEIDGTNRLQFANNIIPAARIDPGVAAMVQDGAFPSPNKVGTGSLGLTRNFFSGGATTFFRDTIDLKTNFNLSDTTSGFIRFSLLDYRMSNAQTLGPFGGNRLHPTNSNPGTGFGNTYSGTISLTHVFTPNFVLDGYYGYTLVDTNVEQQRLDENLGSTVLGIPGLQSDRRIDGGWPRLRIDGFEVLGISNSFQPYFRSDPQNQIVLNGNYTKGSHNIRFGTDLYFQDLDHNQPEFSGGIGAGSGEFRFRGQTTELAGNGRDDFNSWGSFLLGLPREAGKIWQFNENGFFTRTKFYTAFLQDRWQINPKLTMSYGVRMEIFPFPGRKTRGLERFDFVNNQQWACGVGSIPRDCGIDQGRVKFVPRLGFAYRATDNTVLRLGYGITNDPFNWARPLRTNYPILAKDGPAAPNSRYFATTLREGLNVITEPDLGNGILEIPLTTAVNTFDADNAVRGYIQSWNLTLEHRLGAWLGSAGYVATRSVNQLAGLEQNWAPIGTGNPGRVLNQKFGRVAGTRLFGSLGTAKYDSLQTKLERRFANGYQMNFAYTWSHALGYTGEDSGAGTRSFDLPEFYSRAYSSLNLDIRHNFQFTGIFESPFGQGKRWGNSGPAKWILGGWQFNHLFSFYTGTPFSISADDGDLNAPPSNQVADCIGTPRRLPVRGDQSLYSRDAFAQPTGARFGTCGLNILRSPALYNLDIGIFRKFTIGERVDIQFRAEGFNMANTPHFRNPSGTNINSGNFMILNRIRNTGREGIDQRFFRFGLRLGW